MGVFFIPMTGAMMQHPTRNSSRSTSAGTPVKSPLVCFPI